LLLPSKHNLQHWEARSDDEEQKLWERRKTRGGERAL
jgi:hypothetical protein